MSAKTPGSAGREETQLIGGHFPKSLAKELRRVAVEEDTTIRALLERAIKIILHQHGQKIAREQAQRPPDDKAN